MTIMKLAHRLLRHPIPASIYVVCHLAQGLVVVLLQRDGKPIATVLLFLLRHAALLKVQLDSSVGIIFSKAILATMVVSLVTHRVGES